MAITKKAADSSKEITCQVIKTVATLATDHPAMFGKREELTLAILGWNGNAPKLEIRVKNAEGRFGKGIGLCLTEAKELHVALGKFLKSGDAKSIVQANAPAADRPLSQVKKLESELAETKAANAQMMAMMAAMAKKAGIDITSMMPADTDSAAAAASNIPF